MSTPTQVARPWRTTIRSALQTGISAVLLLGLVVPEVVEIVLEETGGAMPDGLRLVLLGAAAAVTVASAIVTRVMAIPVVDDWLARTRFLNKVAADPSGISGPPAERGAVHAGDAIAVVLLLGLVAACAYVAVLILAVT